RFGVDRRQLDPKRLERVGEGADETFKTTELRQAVAQTRRQRPGLGVENAHLVLDRRERFVAQLGQIVEDAPQDFPRRQLTTAAVGPAWCGEADLPARPPRQVVQGGWIGMDEQVARARANAEAGVV